MSGWSTVTKQRSQPRKKPLAKRTPVDAPEDLNDDESAVFAILVSAYPKALSPEDILEQSVRNGESDLTMEKIWKALDGKKLNEVCVLGPNVTYIVRTK